MQIRLVTGVNIRLCFQIDIKYIQILFSPKSSSCRGLGMGLSTPSDSPRSLKTEGDSSASRAVCAGSAEELQLPFINSLLCFCTSPGKKPILARNPSSWWWKSSGSSCGAHLPPTYRWGGPQGVFLGLDKVLENQQGSSSLQRSRTKSWPRARHGEKGTGLHTRV